MKSYSMIAAAILFAAHWLGPHPNTWAVQQPAVQSDAGQKESPSRSTDSNPAAPAPQSPSPQGSFFIVAEFTQALNAKKLKPGDQVKAEVTQDVVSHGKIIIPVESKLVGHVTEVKSRRAEDPESRLGIVFDRVLLKHRTEVDFRGVLHALSAPAQRRSRVDEPDQMLSPGLMGMNRSSGPTPMGASNSSGRSSSSNGSSIGSGGTSATNPAGPTPSIANGLPTGPVPTTNAGNSAGGIPNYNGPAPAVGGAQRSLSVGQPLGVFGLKGLTLTSGATDITPGPVILSRMDDVKLESGTQVLLKITDAKVTQP